MKRILVLLLTVLLCMAAFCGCSLFASPASLEAGMEIPEDGIIPKAFLETLKKENKIATFYGKSGEISYQWTVFGSDIRTPEDTDLGIQVLEDTEGAVSFRFRSEKAFSFTPLLSLHLSRFWDADHAVVCQGNSEPLCSASVTGKETTVLNFPVTQVGEFTVKAVTEDAPEEKPLPVEPENQQVDEKTAYTCTFSIECTTIFHNLEDLNEEKLDSLPKDGIILPETTVTFYQGESVYDVLQRLCKDNGIHLEASWTPIYNSTYVEGIHNLYEFDCGSGSGWSYRVNGWYPNYGCSRYQLAQGDVVEWRFTCDLGADIGGGYAVGG